MRILTLVIQIFLAQSIDYHVEAQSRTILEELLVQTLLQLKMVINKGGRPIERNHRSLLINQKKAFLPMSDKQFPCDLGVAARSAEVPRSVHEVRPADIDVIGAIGDSLTAGFGISATDLLELFVENRGKSFSAGGEGSWNTAFTLPNVLKMFNPRLYGYSTNSAISDETGSKMNVAEGFYTSDLMPGLAKKLVRRMRSDLKINITEDWKMITHMIGDNDFCFKICYLDDPYELLETHRRDLLEVLRIFKKYLPRTIVNIVPPPNLQIVWKFTNKSPSCRFFNTIECPCIFDFSNQERIPTFIDVMTKWQHIDIEIANSPEFDLDDFTVIGHTFMLNYSFPKNPDGTTDFGYLSPDCFHLSERGQSQLGFELWNSLMEPYFNKSTHETPFMSKFGCPSKEQPYIPTRRNSRK